MRVLLTRLSAFGDIVHTWPLAEALARDGSPVELAWVVEETLLPLVAGHPAVSRVIQVATRRWRRRPLDATTRHEVLRARSTIREFAPDVAIDPQGLVKSALWGVVGRAPERVGLARAWRRELLAGGCYTRTVAPPAGTRHVVDINLALLTAIGGAAPYGSVPDATFLLRGAPSPPSPVAAGSVVLLPGTGGRGKSWGPESYIRLARQITAAGKPVLVAWGPGELELAEGITTAAGNGTTLAPPTSIPELAALMSRCAAVVGGDTGPVHLAAALGVPTVAVFIATDPERNGPRGARARIVSASRGSARRGGARSRPGGEVNVPEVLTALSEFLSVPRSGAG